MLNAETGLPDQIEATDSFVSPRLGMRFAFRPLELLVYRPDGSRFLSFQEINDPAEAERRRADGAQQHVERQREENDRLRHLLRAAGIDPDEPVSPP